MNKIKIKLFILLSTFSSALFAQNMTQGNIQQEQPQSNKRIIDLVNEKFNNQINEAKQKKEENEKSNEDISKYYNSPGSDYNKKITNGLEDYQQRKEYLQKRIEELKLERELKIKQQVELESRLRMEAIKLAEETRLKQLQIEEEKRKEAKAEKESKNSSENEEKKKPKAQRKVISSDTKDYYEKQRKLMETQSY